MVLDKITPMISDKKSMEDHSQQADSPHANPGTRSAFLDAVSTRAVALVLVLTLVVAAPAGVAAGAHGDDMPTEPAFVVDLHEDGSAEVTVVVTFDLETEDERDAFQSYRDDQSAQTEFRDEFVDRMQSIATTTGEETGREMQISDPSITFSTAHGDDTGVVALSVTWHGLAAQNGDELVVTEPFTSEFTTDRKFVVTAPDEYALETSTPEPTSQTDNSATWSSGTDLDGYQVVVSPAGTGPLPQPGFGVVAAVLAFAAVGFFARRTSN